MTVLFCISLISGYLKTHEVPVNEYAMAEITYAQEGWAFEATVIESRMNSLKLMNTDMQIETMSYSTADYALQALTSKLDIQQKHFAVDCWMKTAGGGSQSKTQTSK